MFEYDNNAKLAVEILDKYDISEELLDEHGINVIIVARDVTENDYLITFSNQELME